MIPKESKKTLCEDEAGKRDIDQILKILRRQTVEKERISTMVLEKLY